MSLWVEVALAMAVMRVWSVKCWMGKEVGWLMSRFVFGEGIVVVYLGGLLWVFEGLNI